MNGKGNASTSTPRRSPRRAAARRPVQSPPIVRVMVTDALKTWVVPSLAGSSAAALWVASIAGLVPEQTSAAWVSFALLVLVLFTSLRHWLFSEDRAARVFAAAFAVIWLMVLFAGIYRRSFPGAPLATGVLRADSTGLSLPARSHFALIVDGRFKASTAQGSRTGQYRLEVVPAQGEKQLVDGKFQDTWAHQRLGRRGSTVVEIQHTSVQHRIQLPNAIATTLRLGDIDPALEPDLHVTVVPDTNPWLFPVMGLVGFLVALAMEKRMKGDGGVTMMVSVTFFIVDSYLRWGSPHPQIRDLVGAILIGGILGAPIAALLWRIVPRRWFLFRSE